MKRFIDEEKKTIWYFSESGFPTYMAINNYRNKIHHMNIALLVKKLGKN